MNGRHADAELAAMLRERDRLATPLLLPVGPQEGRRALVEVWDRHIARVVRDAARERER